MKLWITSRIRSLEVKATFPMPGRPSSGGPEHHPCSPPSHQRTRPRDDPGEPLSLLVGDVRHCHVPPWEGPAPATLSHKVAARAARTSPGHGTSGFLRKFGRELLRAGFARQRHRDGLVTIMHAWRRDRRGIISGGDNDRGSATRLEGDQRRQYTWIQATQIRARRGNRGGTRHQDGWPPPWDSPGDRRSLRRYSEKL